MEVISCDLLPWAIGDVSGQHGLSWWGSLVLSAYGAPSDLIHNVSIDAGPINCLSGLYPYLLHSLLCAMEVSKGAVEKFGGTCTWSPFRRIPALMDSSSWVPQKYWTILRICLRQSGHPLRVKQYRVLYTVPILWLLRWYPFCQWIAAHAGCFGGWG